MSKALRKDGEATFYQIESLYKDDFNQSGWSRYNFPDFCKEIENWGFDKTDTIAPSGTIWQTTGHHGTTNLEYITRLALWTREHYPEHQHRVVRVTITQKTLVILTLEQDPDALECTDKPG